MKTQKNKNKLNIHYFVIQKNILWKDLDIVFSTTYV